MSELIVRKNGLEEAIRKVSKATIAGRRTKLAENIQKLQEERAAMIQKYDEQIALLQDVKADWDSIYSKLP